MIRNVRINTVLSRLAIQSNPIRLPDSDHGREERIEAGYAVLNVMTIRSFQPLINA